MTEALDRLTLNVNERKSAIRRAALSQALLVWSTMVSGPSEDDAEQFARTLAPRHTGATQTIAALVDAYIGAFLAAHGMDGEGEGIDPAAYATPRGVDVEDLLTRPIVEMRTALSRGESLPSAMAHGRRRLESIVGTDIQQAYRLALRDRMGQEPAIPGYRRVLRGSKNCGLCIVASTQQYKRERLMPIHPGCDCGVQPLIDTDPNQTVVDLPRLKQAKRLIREQGISYTDRSALANLQVDLDGLDDIDEVEHGELGPILGVARHRDTVPDWVRNRSGERSPRGFVPSR